MKRILIIGSPGAGKSTFAVRLGRLIHLPIIHLDKEFWQPGWKETPRDKWTDRVKELAIRDKWIIDGAYDRTLEIRLSRADTVIFLDYPRYICFWRIFKRIVSNWGQVRFDMAEGCPERLDFPFLKWVWNYRRDHYPNIFEHLQSHFADGNLVVLKSISETNRFMDDLTGIINT
jgi:adenylate kinase family enzyme